MNELMRKQTSGYWSIIKLSGGNGCSGEGKKVGDLHENWGNSDGNGLFDQVGTGDGSSKAKGGRYTWGCSCTCGENLGRVWFHYRRRPTVGLGGTAEKAKEASLNRAIGHLTLEIPIVKTFRKTTSYGFPLSRE